MKKLFFFTMIFVVNSLSAQSDLEKILKGGEIIVNGLSILKTNNSKSEKNLNSKYIESVCVKNKLTEKITFKLFRKDSEDFEVKKEMIIQKEGKECVFELPKGIYTYEILLSNNEVFKKGEYKFNEDITITVKEN